MNIVLAIVFLISGLVMLWKCADLLVAGAVSLAQQLGISRLVIGLTIVAMGTSAPEVCTSIAAALRGMGDIAVGNVYGSNIANLALVGGLVALIRPLKMSRQTLRREIPAMLLVALLLWPVLFDKNLSRPEGLILLVAFAALIILTVRLAKRETTQTNEHNTQHETRNTKKNALLIAIGLAGLALGAEITVRGAVFIGEQIGLSNAVIGLTIIAIGTSLPELATCIAAAVRGHHDISIGNLVGSNIFNALLVVGTAGIIRPVAIAQRLAAGLDYWIMIAVSAAFALIAITGRGIIGRAGGLLLLSGYIGYMVYVLAFSV